MFERAGVVIGLVLIALVVLCAIMLGRKAEQSVSRFRDEDHKRFERPKPS